MWSSCRPTSTRTGSTTTPTLKRAAPATTPAAARSSPSTGPAMAKMSPSCSAMRTGTPFPIQKHYKDLANEEIESVKEMFKERMVKDNVGPKGEYYIPKENDVVIQGPTGTPNLEVIKNQEMMEKIINESNYKAGVDLAEEGTESQQVEEEDDSDYTVPVEVEEGESIPYVITEDEFGEFGNEEQTLIYYSDFVLADEDDDIITDPESVVGEALKEFNEDPLLERVYVRDENKEIDYIILKSEKSYSEVNGEEEQ